MTSSTSFGAPGQECEKSQSKTPSSFRKTSDRLYEIKAHPMENVLETCLASLLLEWLKLLSLVTVQLPRYVLSMLGFLQVGSLRQEITYIDDFLNQMVDFVMEACREDSETHLRIYSFSSDSNHRIHNPDSTCIMMEDTYGFQNTVRRRGLQSTTSTNLLELAKEEKSHFKHESCYFRGVKVISDAQILKGNTNGWGQFADFDTFDKNSVHFVIEDHVQSGLSMLKEDKEKEA